MTKYIINRNEDNKGHNEIHKDNDCIRLPLIQNQVYLGWFNDAVAAKVYAKSIGWTNADGCYHCSNEAHTG